MSEQNRYQIECNYKHHGQWEGWLAVGVCPGDTWKDASRIWIDERLGTHRAGRSETPSEDGRSGIIEIQLYPSGSYMAAKVKATIIED